MQKCIWGKNQELILALEFIKNEELNMAIPIFVLLCLFLIENLVRVGHNEEAIELLDYFVQRWLENEQIPFLVYILS